MNTKEEKEDFQPVYTLGVVSRLSGLPSHSIRQYIDKGLIIPYKMDSKRHLFSEGDVKRLNHLHLLIQERGLNFSGIRTLLAMVPCWEIRSCSADDQQRCEAFSSSTTPCWEASEKGIHCRNEDCRTCKVYRLLNDTTELKSAVRELSVSS